MRLRDVLRENKPYDKSTVKSSSMARLRDVHRENKPSDKSTMKSSREAEICT